MEGVGYEVSIMRNASRKDQIGRNETRQDKRTRDKAGQSGRRTQQGQKRLQLIPEDASFSESSDVDDILFEAESLMVFNSTPTMTRLGQKYLQT